MIDSVIRCRRSDPSSCRAAPRGRAAACGPDRSPPRRALSLVGGRTVRDRAREGDSPGGVNPLAITYLNRLSDLLFILTRVVNGPNGDVLWVPGGERVDRARQWSRTDVWRSERARHAHDQDRNAPGGAASSQLSKPVSEPGLIARSHLSGRSPATSMLTIR